MLVLCKVFLIRDEIVVVEEEEALRFFSWCSSHCLLARESTRRRRLAFFSSSEVEEEVLLSFEELGCQHRAAENYSRLHIIRQKKASKIFITEEAIPLALLQTP